MALSWREVGRFIDAHPDYPLILKGIATADKGNSPLEYQITGKQYAIGFDQHDQITVGMCLALIVDRKALAAYFEAG